MKRLAITLLLAGCWRGDPPPPAAPPAPAARAQPAPAPRPRTQSELAFEAMRGFKDQMCACKDKACADNVQDQMNQWAMEIARSDERRPGKFSDEQIRAMQDLGNGYAECMTAAMMATP